MNKTYKSIWNETLGTYVAASETATSSGRKTTSTRRSRRAPARAHAGQLVLEQRIVFDAALPATMIEVSADGDSGHQELVDAYEVEVEDVSVAPTTRDNEEGSLEVSPQSVEEAGDGIHSTDSAESSDSLDPSAASEADGVEQSSLDADEQASEADELTGAESDQIDEGETDADLDPARVEIIVVDSVVADITDFIASHPGEIIYLDPQRDGVEQLAEALQGRTDVDAIHILSHGEAGQVHLGSSTLTTESIQGEHADDIETIRAALSPDADLLIYGCDIAGDEVGMSFVQALAEATGADVAASADATGASELGGDWVLEAQQGQVETVALDVGAWQGLLGTSISITSDNVLSGGLGFSVQAYNPDGSPGLVSVQTGSPPGFGVAGVASGADTEIGETGGLAEQLEITFDGSVESADVWVAWLNSSETALVNLYQGGDLVGSWTQFAGTDTVDGPFQLSAGGVPFDRMVFTVSTDNASTGDDYLVNRIDFVLMRPPSAQNDAFTTSEDAPVNGNLFANNGSGFDTDPDGDSFTVTANTDPANGTVVITSNGDFTYTPNADFNGSDSFTYTITDSDGGTSTATVTVTVTPVNDAPMGADDSITASEDVPFVGTLPVAADVDGDALSYALTSAPANGSVVINGDGSYTYTPAADYNGADSFTYTVSDGNGGSNTYTVSVGVTPVQDTVADNLSTPEDTAITFNVLTGAGGASADNFEGTPQVTATTNPANGVIVVAGDGTITYTPNANYSGPDSFTYTVTSPAGVTETETVNITVTSVNDVPVANDDSFTTDEDTSVNIPVLGNDSDPEGDLLTVSEIDGQPAVVGTPVTLTDGSGTVTLNLDGTLTFEPTPDYNGPVSFTYEVEDGNGGSDTATVTGTVNPVNDAPVGADDSITASEDVPFVGTLPVGSDVDADALSYALASAPANGSVVINGDGSYTYTPAADYNGADSFTYTVSDGNGGSNTYTVSVGVTPVQDTVADNLSTPEDTAITFNVLTGAGGASADNFEGTPQVTATSSPANGVIVVSPDGTITYTPNANYIGPDSFTYTVTSPAGVTETETVNITVTSVNDVPVVDAPLANQSDMDGETITPIATADSFSDVDGDTLSFSATGLPAGLTIDAATGEISGTLSADASQGGPASDGVYSVTVTANDGNGGTVSESFTWTVGNPAPVAVADGFTAAADAPATVVGNALGNDSDPDGDALTVAEVNGAAGNVGNPVAGSAGGLFTVNPDGSVSFDPNGEFDALPPGDTVTTTVSYTVSDGQGGTDTATITVTVTGTNNEPVATDDVFAVGEDDAGASLGNVITGDTGAGPDSDIDGGTLTVTEVGGAPGNVGAAVAGSAGGLFTVNPDGTVSFDPNGEFDALAVGETTSTTISYTISDGQGGFDTATITVTVNGLNDAPDAVDDSFTTDEDTSVNIPVLGNDSDPDGDPLTVSEIDGQPAVVGTPVTLTDGSGTVTLNLDGTLTFEPTPDYNGPVSFTYEVEDGNGGSDTATVTGTVNPVNDPPVAVADGFTAAADAPLAVVGNALGNDSDPDGDALAVTPQGGVAGSAGGVFSIDAAGAVSFDPAGAFDDLAPGATRDTTLVYEISDGQGGFDTATITVTVTGVNNAPVATDNAYTVGEDDAAAVVGNALTDDSGSGVDSDVDGGTLAVTPQSGVAGSAGGIFSIDAAGVVSFDPNGEFESLAAGETATTTLTYEISDGQGGYDTATITVTVNGANDAPVGAADSITASEDVPFVGTLPVGSDVDADALSYALASAPANGSVVINGDGSYAYTPAADYNGADSFTYTVSDGNGGSNTYTVSVNVLPVQDTVADNLSTPEDTAITFNVLTGAGGASADNFEGTPQVTATSSPANGVIVVSPDGTITYTPNANYSGPDSFTYTVTSPAGVTETETVNITVTSVNDVPVANDDSFTTDEDTSVNIPVLGNDSDPEGDPLTVSEIDGQPAVVGTPVTLTDGSGTVTLNLDGTLTFEPTPDYNGPVSFTYEVEDGNGGSDTAMVTGTVNPVNDPPVAVDDGPFTTSANEPLTGNVLGNDSDPDGDPLTVTGFTVAGDPTVYPAGTTASMPGVGTLVIQPDGGFTFVPATDYVGPVPSATYTVSDGGATDTAVLSFGDVQPGPVPPTVVPPQPGPGTGPGPVPPIIDVLPEVNPPLVPVNPPPASVNSDAGGTSPVNLAPRPAAAAGQMPGNHLHVLVAVGESSQSQFLTGGGLAGIQANAPLLGEAQSQTPDNLLFVQAGGNHLAGMGAEPGLGDVRQVPHSLHVQHAVRHQPIVSDIGLYVQQAVRASQLESAVRNAVLDAHHTATPGFDSLMDPFALGAPRPDVPDEPAEKPAAAPQPRAAEQQPQEVKPDSEQSVAETEAETPAPVEAPRLQPRAAVGFRAQLQGMGKDRSVSARPLTRDVAHV